MDAQIVLGRILQKFIDLGISKFENYNQFEFISIHKNSIKVTRERGKDTPIPFNIILIGIKAYQSNPDLYDDNTTALRNVGIKFYTSPIFSMLHLIPKEAYML